MSAALQPRPMTLAEFLAWEERQPIRYEFDGERPVAMAGGSLPHAIISGNLFAMLHARLRGGPCRPYNSDAKVIVDGRVRYPDVSVSCSRQPDRTLRRQGVVPDPVVLFEVLSEGTAKIDHAEKNLEYASTASVLRYVILEQDQVLATVFERRGEDWVGHIRPGAETSLAFPELGIEPIRLGDLYEGVEFEAPSDG